MKIVFISNWYSENMGYIENCLPKSLAQLGHEVHIITSTGQVYFNQPHYEVSLGRFLGTSLQPEGVKQIEGVKVHRLPHYSIKKQIILRGLARKIKEIKPDVVHSFSHADINTLHLVFIKFFMSFKLFTANHTSFLAFEVSKKENKQTGWHHRPLRFLVFTLPGMFISLFIKKCFCVTTDAADVAVSVYGVQKHKTKVTTLGIDIDLFKPDAEVRKKNRDILGFKDEDIVCIYTGKFSNLKNPLLLAQAIEQLNHKSLPFKGLFIGDGEEKEDIMAVEACTVLPFQQHKDLAQFYQASDIAVWPFGESSSQLDVVAAGLSLVLSDSVQTYDRVDSVTVFAENGAYRPKIVGRFFHSHDLDYLIHALESLQDEQIRAEIQVQGMTEVVKYFSWNAIAQRRLTDYKN